MYRLCLSDSVLKRTLTGLTTSRYAIKTKPVSYLIYIDVSARKLRCYIVVSASSDGQIRYWNPYGTGYTESSLLGTHSDYVRCLAYPREQNWIASGSFDRTIKLWNITRSGDPIITLNPPDANSPKASVYALATDPFGRCIASGSPERVVRMWDPRSGKRTAKLVGHTDNIRAIVISDDSKYVRLSDTVLNLKLTWSGYSAFDWFSR